MQLGKTNPRPPGYYLRSAADDAERGPLSAENLHDLAEFQHVSPDSLVRTETETEFRPLHTFPELLEIVFPEQKRFGFKPRAQIADPDADLPAIDVRDIHRCAPGETPETTVRPTPPPTPESTKTDIQQLLAANQALAKSRRPPPPPERKRRFEFRRISLAVRWSLAAVLLYTAIVLWRTLPNPAWALLLSMPLFAFIAALIAGDVLDWSLDWFSNRFSRQPPAPVDYSEAAELFRNGKWQLAARAYAKILAEDPHQLRAYREGISAAAAAGNKKLEASFRAAARKHLGQHDQNLLSGALRRHGLPPLSEKPNPEFTE